MLAIWASRYTKVGPNQVLVISGRKHRVIDPDGTVARGAAFTSSKAAARSSCRCIEKVDILSLELLTIDVQTPGGLHEQRRAGEGGWRRADQGQGR